MKKLVLPLVIVAVIVGLYEQSKAQPNVYVLVISIVILMYGVMRLSAKIPSKHSEPENENEENDVQ